MNYCRFMKAADHSALVLLFLLPAPWPSSYWIQRRGSFFSGGGGQWSRKGELYCFARQRETHQTSALKNSVSPRRCSLSVPAADMIWSEFPQTGVWELNLSWPSEVQHPRPQEGTAVRETLEGSGRAAHLFPHILYQQFKLSRVFAFLVEEGSPEGGRQPTVIWKDPLEHTAQLVFWGKQQRARR